MKLNPSINIFCLFEWKCVIIGKIYQHVNFGYKAINQHFRQSIRKKENFYENEITDGIFVLHQIDFSVKEFENESESYSTISKLFQYLLKIWFFFNKISSLTLWPPPNFENVIFDY